MFPLVTLSAALLFPAQPPALASAPADAPKGEPPVLAFVVGDADGRAISQLVRIPEGAGVRVLTPDGKPDPEAQRTLAARGPVLQLLPEAGVTVRTRGGKGVAYADAAKRVKDGAVAALFLSRGGSSPDPAYLKALAADTLVLTLDLGPASAEPVNKK